MPTRTRERGATYEDLLQVPEQMIAEIIEGELYAWPRPGPLHANAASVLGMRVGPPYQLGDNGPGGWWIIDEPELHLGSHVLVPDLAGWRYERMPELPQNQVFSVAPDWICEVLSPSTARIDRQRKMPIYAEQRVSYVWLIDASLQMLEVFTLRDGNWSLSATHGGDEVVRIEPFEAVEIKLAQLWGPPHHNIQ